MKQAKHTPGPWRIWKNGHSIDAPRDEDGARRIVAVAQGDDASEQAGNAYLIAAAPELLEALEALVNERCIDSIEPELVAARAAIAKAKGE